MQAFTAVYLPGWLIFIGGMLIISSVNAATVQAMVNRAGRSNTQLWYMKPGIFVHELLHAVVARLFGLQVTNFSMRADVVSGSACQSAVQSTLALGTTGIISVQQCTCLGHQYRVADHGTMGLFSDRWPALASLNCRHESE